MKPETWTKRSPMTFKEVRVWIMFVLLGVAVCIGVGIGVIFGPNAKPIIIEKPVTPDIITALNGSPEIEHWIIEMKPWLRDKGEGYYDLTISKDKETFYLKGRHLEDLLKDLESVKNFK